MHTSQTPWVFDLEGDGLYEDITRIWCICAAEVETGESRWFFDGRSEILGRSGSILDGLIFLTSVPTLIGHNIIDYDFRVLKKLHDLTYKGTVVDTLILSQLLRPDRYGGHSLDAWGERVGRKKPEHEDWSRFTPEMLHRCSEDVAINTLVYRKLLQEAKEPIQGVKLW